LPRARIDLAHRSWPRHLAAPILLGPWIWRAGWQGVRGALGSPRTPSSAIGNGSHGSTRPDGAGWAALGQRVGCPLQAVGSQQRPTSTSNWRSCSPQVGFALCELLQGGLADSIASKHFTGTHMKCPATEPVRSLIFTARELYNGRVRRGLHRRSGLGCRWRRKRLSDRHSDGKRRTRVKSTLEARARRHAAPHGQTAAPPGGQEPGRRGRSWSAAGLLPRATIGTALKQQPLVACRAVGRSPAKQGGL